MNVFLMFMSGFLFGIGDSSGWRWVLYGFAGTAAGVIAKDVWLTWRG